jgi:hypothetical protein
VTAVAVLLLVALAADDPPPIPVLVREPAGVARRRAPAVAGLPFPRGRVPADQAFSLFDGDNEIPLQVTPLVQEHGTLRWVLLDFQLDLGANEARKLELRPKPGKAAPDPPLRVTESADAIEVDTGPLGFVISRSQPFALLHAVKLRGREIARGGELEVVESGPEKACPAGKPRAVSLEYRGPLRVTIRVDGGFEGSTLRYATRVTAWAGRADLRVQHTIVNSNPEQVFHAHVKSATLGLRPALGREVQAVEGKGSTLLRGGDASISICDRDALTDPPRKIRADAERIGVDFILPREVGRKFRSEHAWIYDCSHKTAEVWFDFEPSGTLEAAARSRLIGTAPPEWYSACDAVGVGPFGTLEDEKAVYGKWGWAFDEKQVPRAPHHPDAFVRWEDNHYESESDSVEGLLLMFLRTGERGFFDQGEAWARYHMDLQAWRSDGWVYDDGAIWFPQGGPLGTKPARKPPNVKYQHWDKGTGDDRELWWLVQAKACYCHFYGAGLVDYYLLTGERDAIEAAVDLAELKNSEFRKHRQFTPGKTKIEDTRGFGRGFYVLLRVLEARPDDPFLLDLARLCRDVLWNEPRMDERGFVPSRVAEGFDAKKDVPSEMKAFMDREGITLEKGWLSDKAGNRWPVVSLGGTWQHAYVHDAADRYARIFGDEDMIDFTVAFGRFAGRYLLSGKCKQTHYYAYMDVPVRGEAWDPWKFEATHAATKDGDGCKHSGWYTRFLPDAMARAYSWTGDAALLERAKEFWHYGSKRGYQTLKASAGPDRVGAFASHHPPKDDSVLSTSRMFHEWAHPRKDAVPPEPVKDLAVTLLGDGRARVRFTAPADPGGRVARYQVKGAEFPIVDDREFDFARDRGVRRSFWRAVNLAGEPGPQRAGAQEEFEVTGVPAGPGPLHFVVASFDDSGNRSGLSNEVKNHAR